MRDFDYLTNDLLDFVYDLQLGVIRDETRAKISDVDWIFLKDFGTRTYYRLGQETHFDYYENEKNLDEFKTYFFAGTPTKMLRLAFEMANLLGQRSDLAPRDLYDLASAYYEATLVDGAQLRKHSNGHSIIGHSKLEVASHSRCTVVETDPVAVQLFQKLLRNKGIRQNFQSKIGAAGDYARRIIRPMQLFRQPPS